MSKTKPSTSPTLRALMEECGVSPARVEVDTGISCASVFRAMRGEKVRRATLMGIAHCCRREVEDVVAAHRRSGGRS